MEIKKISRFENLKNFNHFNLGKIEEIKGSEYS